jgi:linoleoyl-CoA desaturase
MVMLSLGLGLGGAVILHHGGHMRYSKQWYLNAAWVQGAVPVGLWVHHWGLKHRIHHRLPAVFPADRYTTGNMFVRLHPSAPWRPMHRYQYLYIILGYAIYWLSEVASQIRYLINGSIPYSNENLKASQRLLLYFSEKSMCAAVLLPYFLLGNDAWRTGYLLMIAGTIGSIYAGLLVGVGHINMGIRPAVELPESGAWVSYVLSSTVSFRVESRVAGWLSGGLTLHAAHHLRPLASRSELRLLHRQLKNQHHDDDALIEFDTFWHALLGHFTALRQWGRGFSGDDESVDRSAHAPLPPGPLMTGN